MSSVHPIGWVFRGKQNIDLDGFSRFGCSGCFGDNPPSFTFSCLLPHAFIHHLSFFPTPPLFTSCIHLQFPKPKLHVKQHFPPIIPSSLADLMQLHCMVYFTVFRCVWELSMLISLYCSILVYPSSPWIFVYLCPCLWRALLQTFCVSQSLNEIIVVFLFW